MRTVITKLRRPDIFPACLCHTCGKVVPAGNYSEARKGWRRVCGPCIRKEAAK